jgi:5-methylcytosine-specific restriction protein A
MPFNSSKFRDEKYRNPNGVYMKLCNYLRYDPTYKGKGLAAGSKLEKEIWDSYSDSREELHRTAKIIISALSKPNYREAETPTDLEEMDTAVEGRVLTRIHSFRERKPENVEKKKAYTIKKHGKLECEVCGFVFENKYGELGKGFAECHHLIPLSELQIEKKPKLEDFAILCANCHRMIHRKKPWLTLSQLKTIVRDFAP